MKRYSSAWLLMVPGLLLLGVSVGQAETGVGDSGIFSLTLDGISSTPENETPAISGFHRVFPNPFNPVVHIEYSLAQAMPVDLDVFDLRGRLIRTLVASEVQAGGVQSARWDGADEAGRAMPAGVYFARLRTGDGAHYHRMTLLK